MRAAKENLTRAEVEQWMQYVKENGPLSAGQRVDVGIARLCYLVAKSLGGKNSTATLQDFLPGYYQAGSKVADEEELTLEGLARLFD